ncbi:hypothetical protein HYX16_01010 [Candidatus Woesearchaeota archaeon]|nr:hypothetical protein [Candidatus Woesearchaeota archaeon]
MASILSADLFQFVMPIFIFIFIFVVFYALLSKIKLFGENTSLNSLIAFSLAVLFIVIPEARQFIEVATPWFIVFIVAGLMFVMIFMILGVEPEFIKEVAKENALVLSIIVGLSIFIFLFAMSQVFGPGIFDASAAEQTGIFASVRKILFTPKILGFLIILIIAAEVVRRVGFPSYSSQKK